MRGRLGTWALVAGLAALAACGGEPTATTQDSFTIQDFVTDAYGVVTAGTSPSAAVAGNKLAGVAAAAGDPVMVQGVLRTGAPEAGTGGPTATFALQSSILTGLPAKIRVSSSAPFTRLVLGVQGTTGYWEINLPTAVTELQLVVTGATTLPSTAFQLRALVGDANGLGQPAVQNVQAVDLTHADVVVILRWNAYSDVDLHVTDPKGQEIYFANKTSPEGGHLDLDSNPACDIDGVNQEVISWPINSAPIGDYKVVVDYWSDCGVARSDYTVTYMVRGQQAQVVSGSFEGPTSPSAEHEIATLHFP